MRDAKDKFMWGEIQPKRSYLKFLFVFLKYALFFQIEHSKTQKTQKLFETFKRFLIFLIFGSIWDNFS